MSKSKIEEDRVLESYDIGSNSNLIVSVIKDQASDIEHGWREAISNSIDSPDSNLVNLWYNESRSIISDDGEGVDLREERKLLTDMGETSKDRNSDVSIGKFGIGKGQYIAKGRVTILSNGKALHYNIKDWGIEDSVPLTNINKAVSFIKNEGYENWAEHVKEGINKHGENGLTVIISHYEDEVTNYNWKWKDYEKNIKKRFMFTTLTSGVRIFINDECISDNYLKDDLLPGNSLIRSEVLSNGSVALVGLGHKADGEIKIYSNGVFVKNMERNGFGGFIITNGNFDLNFARNDIKSGCDLWDEVYEIVNEESLKLCSEIYGSNLNESAREFLMNQIYSNRNTSDDYVSKDIIRTSNEHYVSISKIRGLDEVGMAKTGSQAADRLSEAYNKIILAEDDSAVEILREEEDLKTFEAEEKAEELGIFNRSEILERPQLTPLQRNKLGIARELSARINIERKIKYGESSLLNGWTDGSNYIAITDNATPSTRWVQWVPELFRLIIHEWCHEGSTEEEHPSHGRNFEEKYRKRIDSNWKHLSDLMEDIEEKGIRSYRIPPKSWLKDVKEN